MTYQEQIYQWLQGKKKIMAVTHKKPDGDALGSLFGVYHTLNKNGFICHIHLAEEMPKIYHPIKSLDAMPTRYFVNREVDLSSYDGVIVLDSARRIMPSYKNLLDITSKKGIPSLCIDHHPDNELYADVNIVEPTHCSTAAILTDTFLSQDFKLTPEAASALLVGIIRDTGGYRFQNTSPRTMRLTADLMELGGDFHGITHAIFFSQELNRIRFISHIINHNLQFAQNNRVLYIILEDELFKQHNFNKKDMEGIIDSIRAIKGVIITCIISSGRDEVKFSLRSCDDRYPINGIAKKLGGGGHRLASGAKMPGATINTATQKFLSLTEELFK